MNKLSLIAALLIASLNVAHADVTVESADKSVQAVIHTAGLNYGINSNKEVQVDAYLSFIKGNSVERAWFALTGCDNSGGRVAMLDEDTRLKTGKSSTWIAGGPSLLDNIAETTCAMATKAAEEELAALKESNKKVSHKQSKKTAL